MHLIAAKSDTSGAPPYRLGPDSVRCRTDVMSQFTIQAPRSHAWEEDVGMARGYRLGPAPRGVHPVLTARLRPAPRRKSAPPLPTPPPATRHERTTPAIPRR